MLVFSLLLLVGAPSLKNDMMLLLCFFKKEKIGEVKHKRSYSRSDPH